MKIAVTGATGLVGSALVRALAADGAEVLSVVRRPSATRVTEVPWDPTTGSLDRSALEGVDAAVHLAGENIAGGRWNSVRKRAILESRTSGTALLARTLAGLQKPPRVLVSASAIGYYGDRGDQWLTEESGPGTGFLPDVCRAWEAAAKPAAGSGIRTVVVRIGIVLSPEGGALARMLTPFRLGLGGPVGSGRQYWSWITLEDLVGILRFAVATPSVTGPVNAVAPNPVTNAEFTRSLARTLRRPSVFPLPAFAARLALGEMAEPLLLASARLRPERITGAGYRFRHPDLSEALRQILAR
jgi:uncharacterized protein